MQNNTQIITDKYGIWEVNWELVRSIVSSYALQKSILGNSKLNTSSESTWYNPFSWGMPEVVLHEVNWPAVKTQRQQFVKSYMPQLYRKAERSVRELKAELRKIIAETADYRATIRSNWRAASQKTMDNINRSVKNYETVVEGLKVTRDLSAETVLVGAIFISGGTGLAVAGAGSGIKGIGSFQDSKGKDNRVAGAILEATSSFVLTAIPIGKASAGVKALTTSEKVAYEGTMVLLEAQFNTASNLASGASVGDAVSNGTLKAVLGTGISKAAGGLFQTPAMQRLLSRSGLPLNIRVARNSSSTIDTKGFLEELSSKYVGYGAGKAADAFYAENQIQNRINESKTLSPAVEASANRSVLDMAIQKIGSPPAGRERMDLMCQ